MKYKPIALKYHLSDFEPLMSYESLYIHYYKLYDNYCHKLNAFLNQHPKLEKIRIDKLLYTIHLYPQEIQDELNKYGGGYINHSLFFQCLGKNKHQLSKPFLEALITQFESVQNFEKQLSDMCKKVFGSGYVFLCLDKYKNLSLLSTPNQINPLINQEIPILAIDLWEHSYYLQYKEKRDFYIENIIKLINYEEVSANYDCANFSYYD